MPENNFEYRLRYCVLQSLRSVNAEGIRRWLGAFIIGTAVIVSGNGILAATSSDARAAALIPEDLGEPADPLESEKPTATFTSLLIERLQTALNTIGVYQGPITGVMDDNTENAIRQYQRMNGQAVTGIVDEALVTHLETAVNVNNLLDTLSTARQARTQDARDALLANPATRDLIVEGLSNETANPVRDPSECFEHPTVRCLLDEAVESAKAIPRDDMRNWALGDILVAQARAGLSDSARDTIRRISDPRMVMVALGEIAAAQARAGQAAGAIAAADIIPDARTKIEAYANIAQIMAGDGLADSVSKAVTKLRQQVSEMDSDARLTAYLAQASDALFRVGKQDEALSLLRDIETAANDIETTENRDTALRHVADTYAGIGDVDHAVSILGAIESSAERVPVIMSAARARAAAGDPDAALEMASSIEAVRYRALVLASIATGQARIGELDAALDTLEKATSETNTIELPFAKDYALSRIALAYAGIASDMEQPDADLFLQATTLASSIEDEKTHAYAVWNIAFLKRKAGYGVPENSKAFAVMVTDQIRSPSGQAWLLAELAESRATVGDGDWAWYLFDRALTISEAIKNSWGRARSVSRLAQSLIRLVETGASRGPDNTENGSLNGATE